MVCSHRGRAGSGRRSRHLPDRGPVPRTARGAVPERQARRRRCSAVVAPEGPRTARAPRAGWSFRRGGVSTKFTSSMAGESLARTHPFSLGAPIANEEERAQFQARLALTWMLVGALAATFWLVASAWVAVKMPGHLHRMWTHPTSRVQLATTGMAFVAWFVTRSTRRGAKVLDAVDAVSSVPRSAPRTRTGSRRCCARPGCPRGRTRTRRYGGRSTRQRVRVEISRGVGRLRRHDRGGDR